jgi:hypothetical protein
LVDYLVSPPGVGDNGKWQPLWTRYVPGMVAGNYTRVNWDGSQAPIWEPVIGEHTCAKVAVSRLRFAFLTARFVSGSALPILSFIFV